MDKLCEIILNSNNEAFEKNHQNEINIIKYFIKQSKTDMISFDNTDKFETSDYIADVLHQYFKSYDIIKFYDNIAKTILIYNENSYIITSEYLNNELYWILTIKFK
jgi:nitrogenase subunit NifH